MLENIYLTYFAGPGYTTVQTVVYALLLVVAVYVIYEFFLKRIDTEIDESFLVAMVPLVVLGGVLRSLGHGDAEIFTGFWFNTPGIHILIAAYTVPVILLSQYLSRRKLSFVKWMWILSAPPLAACFFIVSGIGFLNPEVFLYVFVTTAAAAAAIYPAMVYLPKYLTGTNYWILTGHILDGSSTFVAVTFFGYMEKHVLPGFLMDLTGAWIMLPLKVAVIWPVLYLIDDMVEDAVLRNWLKVVVLVLGLALGVRNTFSAAMGV